MDALTIMNNAPSGSQLLKALKDGDSDKVKLLEPKSAIIDPTNVLNYGGTRPKPNALPMHSLRNIAKTPAIAAIIKTRLNQVARFAKQPRFEGDIGFRIVTKDIEQKMSPADKKEARKLQNLLLTTGAVPNRIRKDNFDRFMRKITQDTLTLDQMCWENVPNIQGQLSEMWALDAATIELVVQEPTSEMFTLPVYRPVTKKGMTIEGEIAYVQRVNGQVIAEYTEDEMCFAVRNPSTDILVAPFGRSELEDLIEIITGILNGIRYNTSYFNHSSLPQGVLEIVGNYKDEHLESFKRMWKTMTSGAAGKWAVPVMALQEGSGFKWTPFKTSNRDMEFNQFLEFMFNIACAVYQIDPNEVGFKSWSSKSSGGLSQSDNTEVKIEQSQDKGFVPLMTFLGQTISSEVIDRYNDEFCLAWVGLDTDLEKLQWNRAKEELEAGTLLVNEYRASRDRESIKQDWAEEAPANATLIQVYTADKQAKAQADLQQQQGQMQGDQTKAQGDQQLQQLQAQHSNAKEMVQLQHGNAKELQGMQHGNAKELQGMQQKHDLTKQGKDQEFQGKESSMGRFHEDAVTDKQHGNAKEMAKLTFGQQKEMQKDSQKHDVGLTDRKHMQSRETSKDDQKHQVAMADHNHANAKDMADHSTHNAEGMADHNHRNAKDMFDHTNKQKGQANDRARQKKLQKSLSDIYLADNKMIERCAEEVHKAWMKTAGTSDNPDMGPYNKLHEAVKETDRATVRAVIEELVKQGVIPDEDRLTKALATAEFASSNEGTIITVNPWDTY